MNTVFTKIAGQGEPLLVLHGWGMSHKVWSSVQSEVENTFRVTWVDLPGHGGSKDCPLGELDDVVERIKPLLKQSMHVLGWSLGGLIAQRLAQRYPEVVRSLTLVATSPSFIQRDNWNHALPVDVLQGFIESLKNDYKATMHRFFSLQFLGVKSGSRKVSMKLIVQKLKDEMFEVTPDSKVLEEGLAILKESDLRGADFDCPRYWVLGRLDKLIPVAVAEDLSVLGSGTANSHEKAKHNSVTIIEGAGHAPFISHPDEFVNQLRKCLCQGSKDSSVVSCLVDSDHG